MSAQNDDSTDEFETFDEEFYLARYPDVRAPVEGGAIKSGYEHYRKHGRWEGRFPNARAAATRSASPLDADLRRRLDESNAELRPLALQHQSSAFLTPHDLTVTALEPSRAIMMGRCGSVVAAEIFKRYSQCEIEFIFRGGMTELPDAPPRPPSDYDFQIIEIALRDVLPDGAHWNLPWDDLAAHEAAFERSSAYLREAIRQSLKWNQKHGLLTFVLNYMRPQQNPMGRLLPKYDLRNPGYFIERLNMVLEEEVLKRSMAFVLDAQEVVESSGRRFTQDDSVAALNHHSFLTATTPDVRRIEPAPSLADHYEVKAADALRSIWDVAIAMYRTVKQVDAVKLVVVDLDDTMWTGVSGDSEGVDVEGWPHGMMEALAYLKKRGVLLAIISKNDEERARQTWRKWIGDRLPMENFICKINWRPKVENMREILADVNLLPRNVVYVDDHPVERAAMSAAFPDLRVLTRFHYYWRRILLWSSETQVPFISAESARRTEMVQAQVQREQTRKEMSRENFLASLGLKVTVRAISGADDPAFLRAFELTNKTNQFNTTGVRWDRTDFSALLGQGAIYVFDVSDKFTPYGTTGAVLTRGVHIEQFVMSCRVAGMDNEIAAMSAIVSDLRARYNSPLTASFQETDANFLCRDFLARCGFVSTQSVWTLPADAAPSPPHIELALIAPASAYESVST
ncbi:MAG: HAD-IIIC family phosphatase [Hyphomicrobiales bacterium]|nr:HAD-IIIC family phosphatase [Hyphomicrobiales bacterium]